MDGAVINQIASRTVMLDMDIKAVQAATGFDEQTIIEGLIVLLQNRLKKKAILKTEYLYLIDFCKYLNSTGTTVNETDIEHYFEIRDKKRSFK